MLVVRGGVGGGGGGGVYEGDLTLVTAAVGGDLRRLTRAEHSILRNNLSRWIIIVAYRLTFKQFDVIVSTHF